MNWQFSLHEPATSQPAKTQPSMSQRFLVVDTCTVINFAAINRIPLFNQAMRDRGRCTQAVAEEIRRLSHRIPYQSARTALDSGCLGEPVELDTDRDRDAVEDIRAALGGVSSNPLKHLGEAESIHAIESRSDLREAIFLTDDRDATYLAGRRGIDVKDTAWLLSDSYAMGDIPCPEPWDLLIAMWEAERGVVLPAGHEAICPLPARNVLPRRTGHVRRNLPFIPIPGADGPRRLEHHHRRPRRRRLMLHPPRHHENVAVMQRHRPLAPVFPQRDMHDPFEHQEELVRVRMHMPQMLTPEVRDLDVVVVDPPGDPRVVRVGEGGQGRVQADW
jgi:predicted nucleic acid-binding protein